RDERLPGLEQVIARVRDATWRNRGGPGMAGEIQRVVNFAALSHLLRLGANPAAGPQVQAIVAHELTALRDILVSSSADGLSVAQRAHLAHGARLIERFLEQPEDFTPPPVREVPPGQP